MRARAVNRVRIFHFLPIIYQPDYLIDAVRNVCLSKGNTTSP